MQQLIMIRIWKWGEAAKIVDIGNSPLWKTNPVGALTLQHFQISGNFWKHKLEVYDIVCMVDGAWTMGESSYAIGGIGGLIKQKSGSTLFTFSGPVQALNAHEAELQAVIFVLKQLKEKQLDKVQVVIRTDSCMIINACYDGIQNHFPLLIPDFDISQSLNSSVSIQFVPGELNDAADRFAKDGVNRVDIFQSWAGICH